MRLEYVHIENYKGIQCAFMSFDATPRSNIYTLVGLNESGKTIILEAIDGVAYREDRFDVSSIPGHAYPEAVEMIPMQYRANFSGTIEVILGWRPNEDDNAKLRAHLAKEIDFHIDDIESFEVADRRQFQNSVPQKAIRSGIAINIIGRYGRGRKKQKYKQEHWGVISDHLRRQIPAIYYFPNAIFDLPKRIDLRFDELESTQEKFYYAVVENIFKAYDPAFDLQELVVKRALSKKASDHNTLENLLEEVSYFVSRSVFESWNRVFIQPVEGKRVSLKVRSDKESVWLEVDIKDHGRVFSLKDRSMGFRWFFVFYLLTQFRRERVGTKEAIFLFDEPAANLHASAQHQLLNSFAELAKSAMIIYSTHSHHLIKPDWLENAFVVKNESILYDHEEIDDPRTLPEISVTPYREFVAEHPDQTTYYQPVLDVLQYRPSDLDRVPNVVMVEGKNDSYTLAYFDRLINGSRTINILPGGGAGSLDTSIRLYLAWARPFIILLDSDTEGQTQRRRYIDLFGRVIEGRIFLASDFLPRAGKGMERLIPVDQQRLIVQAVFPTLRRPTKKHFNRAIQELNLIQKNPGFGREFLADMQALLSGLATKLEELGIPS